MRDAPPPTYHPCVLVMGQLREELCNYLMRNARAFKPYVTDRSYASYVERMRCPGEWGDHLVLLAAEEVFDRPVELYDSRTFEAKGQVEPFPLHFSGGLKEALAGVTPITLRYVAVLPH